MGRSPERCVHSHGTPGERAWGLPTPPPKIAISGAVGREVHCFEPPCLWCFATAAPGTDTTRMRYCCLARLRRPWGSYRARERPSKTCS